MIKYDVRYKLTAPLSHIGETASTGSYFQTVLTSAGRLPVVTGNSVRGQLRDCAAKHLLDALGTKVDKEVFHVLFSGGNLGKTMKSDIGLAKSVRGAFPSVSVFGGAIDSMILSGKLGLTFAHPICKESCEITGVDSSISWHNLIDEMEFTRTDDSKSDELAGYISDVAAEVTAKASTQMRFAVQYMAVGAELYQRVWLNNATDIEEGALLNAIREWFKLPKLGGMSSRGFGSFDATVTSEGRHVASVSGGEVSLSGEAAAAINQYNDFLLSNTPNFNLLKGSVKGGKASNRAAEGNSEAD